MSRATDEFREHLWVFNDIDYARQAGIASVFVAYYPSQAGLGRSRSAYWAVHGLGFDTDPDAHFTDHGSKTFTVGRREDKQATLELALAWAGEKFAIPAWEKSPLGSWVALGSVAAMKAKLKAAKANPDLKCFAAQVPSQPGWDDRRGRFYEGKPAEARIAARTRELALGYLAELGFETDPAALFLVHPDQLNKMVEGQVTVNLGRPDRFVLRMP